MTMAAGAFKPASIADHSLHCLHPITLHLLRSPSSLSAHCRRSRQTGASNHRMRKSFVIPAACLAILFGLPPIGDSQDWLRHNDIFWTVYYSMAFVAVPTALIALIFAITHSTIRLVELIEWLLAKCKQPPRP